MATQWGNNSLAPGASAGWCVSAPNQTGFLPVIQAVPLSPSSTDNSWYITEDGYPYQNELCVSTISIQLSDDLSTLSYYFVVQNNSNNYIEYAFLEADL